MPACWLSEALNLASSLTDWLTDWLQYTPWPHLLLTPPAPDPTCPWPYLLHDYTCSLTTSCFLITLCSLNNWHPYHILLVTTPYSLCALYFPPIHFPMTAPSLLTTHHWLRILLPNYLLLPGSTLPPDYIVCPPYILIPKYTLFFGTLCFLTTLYSLTTQSSVTTMCSLIAFSSLPHHAL